jgi:hypothetical protein
MISGQGTTEFFRCLISHGVIVSLYISMNFNLYNVKVVLRLDLNNRRESPQKNIKNLEFTIIYIKKLGRAGRLINNRALGIDGIVKYVW